MKAIIATTFLLATLLFSAAPAKAQIAEIQPCFSYVTNYDDGTGDIRYNTYCLQADHAYTFWYQYPDGSFRFPFDIDPQIEIFTIGQYLPIFGEPHVVDLGSTFEVAAARGTNAAGELVLTYPVNLGRCYSVESSSNGKFWGARGYQWLIPERRNGFRSVTLPNDPGVLHRVRRIR